MLKIKIRRKHKLDSVFFWEENKRKRFNKFQMFYLYSPFLILFQTSYCVVKFLLRDNVVHGEMYSEPYETTRMNCFAKIVNCIFVKCSILDVWQSSQHKFELNHPKWYFSPFFYLGFLSLTLSSSAAVRTTRWLVNTSTCVYVMRFHT